MNSNEPNPNEGHRGRLREKFLKNGLGGFLDYEIVELLLTFGIPRKDCKALAKELISKFKTLSGVLDAPTSDLQQVNGIGPSSIIVFKLFQELRIKYSSEVVDTKIILDSPQKIFEYMKVRIGNEKKEHFVLLCLDTRNNLIVEDVSIGTLNASLVHPREVFKPAILNNSSHVVVVHNHPSGDPTPSDADISVTKRLVDAGKLLGIAVVDHIIIGDSKFVSLKGLGVISQ